MEQMNDRVCFLAENRPQRIERILQFGEGVFLRAFIDDLIDDLNGHSLYDGGIAVVQPRPGGKAKALNEQDGLYTLLLRGLENGVPVVREKVVSAITRGIDPYQDYESYRALIRSPELRFVVSNTTEAGIVYSADDHLDDCPQLSFPGKVAALLYERFQHFHGDRNRGLVFIPCELIDDNGTKLREIVLQFAKDWGLGEAFAAWLDEACTFTNTLVDRIVTGYPKNEAAEIAERLGYEDRLLNTGEVFSFFAVSGFEKYAQELPLDKGSLSVLLTDDVTPYKQRKVRILKGAHTALTPVALLCSMQTVGEAIADEMLNRYVRAVLYDEVIPTINMDRRDLMDFAAAVFDRFANPFIQHQLTGIALNSTSKWQGRILPSLDKYLKNTGKLPRLLVFSFAATLELFAAKREDIADVDDIEALFDKLKTIAGFERAVDEALADIRNLGCRKALEMRL